MLSSSNVILMILFKTKSFSSNIWLLVIKTGKNLKKSGNGNLQRNPVPFLSFAP